MANRVKWKRLGAVSRVLNEQTNKKFVISTARNPYRVWETAVFEANEMFLLVDLNKPLLVLNAGNRDQAEEQHIQAAIAFRTKEPSEVIRQYKLEGVLPLGQQVYSEEDMNSHRPKKLPENELPNARENVSKYRFWTKIQKITLLLFVILLVMCFVLRWWLLIPAMLSLVLNAVAYANRMTSLGRKPDTKDIDEVV